MEDLRKIRLMVSLAIYDKHYGEKDRKITSKYRRDYVYFKNLSMRLGVVAGFAVICGIYYLYRLIIENEDVFLLISRAAFIKMGLALVALLVLYSVVCTIKYRREYDLAQKRMDIYEERIKKLNGQSKVKRGQRRLNETANGFDARREASKKLLKGNSHGRNNAHKNEVD